MADGIYTTATEIARAIRERQISAEEVVTRHLQRIASVNPRLNAVVHLASDRALAEARAADQALAQGTLLGPLHGVPITVKDSFDTAGLVSTAGTLGRQGFIPEVDAVAVARLRATGAIVLGKTNLAELSSAYETDNLVYQRTNNPYDLTRTPGGSSGGEAAIIAAGGSPLGLGTDAGGSIRWPAHCCGIAGLKPTRGRIPTTGIFPPALGATGPVWHVGTLARRVQDLSLTLPILAGPDWRDPNAVAMPLGDPGAIELRGLRAAFYTADGVEPPTPETAEAVRSAARALDAAGLQVEEACPPGIDQCLPILLGVFGADGGAGLEGLLTSVGTSQVSPLVRRFIALLQANALSSAQFAATLVKWDLYRATMLTFMERYDLIICPVNARPALPHDTSLEPGILPGFSYTIAYSLTGWPVVVLRAGTSPEGLPIGVQVVAQPWREDVALAAAERIEATMGDWPPLNAD